MKPAFCLFMGIRKSTAFLFFFSSLSISPTLPKCHVVMPTSSLNQETGNDCTPTALWHTHKHSQIQTRTHLFTLSKGKETLPPISECSHTASKYTIKNVVKATLDNN